MALCVLNDLESAQKNQCTDNFLKSNVSIRAALSRQVAALVGVSVADWYLWPLNYTRLVRRNSPGVMPRYFRKTSVICA